MSAFVETEVTSRPDRAFLLKSKLHSQYIQNNYDVVLIDTQGAVGPLLDTAAFAATNHVLLCPIMPEV
ncbi:ParA family protein [Neisseria gonorrhoeae]|uniref:ParA family protein n=1 Tax=Neisseria gonorrhoeae TaxID=485 RepID=UPI0027DE2B8E|nr:hypothetical protein [Neisseria gonorrhoeae]